MTGVEKIKRKTFADLLVQEGIISKDVMDTALKEQWSEGIPLEQYLIQTGHINEDIIVSILTTKFPLKFVDLSVIQPDPDAVDHIPYRVAKKYTLIPLRKSGKSLAVAMANPLNREMVGELKKVTDLKIIPFVAKISSVMEYLKTYYEQAKIEEEKLGAPGEYEKLKGEVGLTLRNDQTFDNFVIGKPNELAYTFVKGFAETRGVENSRIFISGPGGVGKTHLLNAAGNYILENETFRGILYTESFKFLDLLENVKDENELKKFRLSFTDSDVLLFDDVEMLATHDFAQRQFLYILTELSAQDKQFIITSNLPISGLKTFNRKILSILEAAISAPIDVPDKNLLAQIAKKRLEDVDNIPSKVLDLIADNVNGNIRVLVSICREIATLARMNKSVEVSVVKSILKSYNG